MVLGAGLRKLSPGWGAEDVAGVTETLDADGVWAALIGGISMLSGSVRDDSEAAASWEC